MLLLLLFAAAIAQDTCSSCDGACSQIANVSVGSLCAGAICINGAPVPSGDGNPCTLDDVFTHPDGSQSPVHLPIPNCCQVDGDCQSAPPCQQAVTGACVLSANSSYGWCTYTPMVGCCQTDSDCPARVCYQASCGNCSTTARLFFSERDNSPHLNAWSKRNVLVAPLVASTCQQCAYTPIAQCCVTSADCAYNVTAGRPNPGGCDQGELPICDGNHQCQCGLQPPPAECTVANVTACAPLLARCTQCGATAVCDDGRCAIAVTPGAGTIWCAVNSTATNADQDAFLACGTAVVQRCATACLADEVQLNDTLAFQGVDGACTTNSTTGLLTCHLHCMCDLCDRDASQTVPDEYICCEAVDPNNPGTPICGGEPRTICYSTQANTTDEEAAACLAWGESGGPARTLCPNGNVTQDCTVSGINCTSLWTTGGTLGANDTYTCPNDQCFNTATNVKKRQAPATCNSCPLGTVGQSGLPPRTSPTTCYRDCDGDGNPLCAIDQGLNACCAQIIAGQNSTLFVQQPIYQCCADIAAYNTQAASNGGTPIGDDVDPRQFIASCNVTLVGNDQQISDGINVTPIIPGLCVCPDGFIGEDAIDANEANFGPVHQDLCECVPQDVGNSANDYVILCAYDVDGDTIPACTPASFCTSQVVPATSAGPAIDDAGACVFANNQANIAPNTPATYFYPPNVTAVFPAFDAGEPGCDCDDSNPAIGAPYGCFTDADGDGAPDCASCELTCTVCPAGTVALLGPVQPPTPASLQSFGGAKVRAPLRSTHLHGKRQAPAPTPAPTNITCPAPTPSPTPLVDKRCDCCDSDQFAYPGSPYCSVNKTLCAIANMPSSTDYDYNCDGVDIPHIVCNDDDDDDNTADAGTVIITTSSGGRIIRLCDFTVNTTAGNGAGVVSNGTEQPWVHNNTEASGGSCSLAPTNTSCLYTPGWCLERKRSIGAQIRPPGKKRSVGVGSVSIPAPEECDGQSVIDPSSGGAPMPLVGTCFEYLAGCDLKSSNALGTHCACDCDVCVLVEQ